MLNKNNHRKKRLEEELKKLISNSFLEIIKDPRIGFLTVTKISLNKNFSLAKVYISILNKNTKTETFKALIKSKGKIKKIISDSLNIRFVPELYFEEDISLEYSLKINEIIKNIKKKNIDEKINRRN